MEQKRKVIYIGGFELPNKNAAAQRVIGIAKSLRLLDYDVIFIHATKDNVTERETDYYGFRTIEFPRGNNRDYYLTGNRIISIIKTERPYAIVAYNYPAFSLHHIFHVCKSMKIRCIADVTEWPKPVGKGIIYSCVKEIDTFYRMRSVHKKLDGIIAVSKYLYNYYHPYVKTVIIPPTVDIDEKKWSNPMVSEIKKNSFVYAGSPSSLKERLDLIVRAIDKCSKKSEICLDIIGITENQFRHMYSWNEIISKAIRFYGRVSHNVAIDLIKRSSWSIIIRENNIVVKAGFPTKIVESISCGTPVLANNFSNISDYLNKGNSLLIENLENIDEAIFSACEKKVVVDKKMFDYRNYLDEVKKVFE